MLGLLLTLLSGYNLKNNFKSIFSVPKDFTFPVTFYFHFLLCLSRVLLCFLQMNIWLPYFFESVEDRSYPLLYWKSRVFLEYSLKWGLTWGPSECFFPSKLIMWCQSGKQWPLLSRHFSELLSTYVTQAGVWVSDLALREQSEFKINLIWGDTTQYRFTQKCWQQSLIFVFTSFTLSSYRALGANA